MNIPKIFPGKLRFDSETSGIFAIAVPLMEIYAAPIVKIITAGTGDDFDHPYAFTKYEKTNDGGLVLTAAGAFWDTVYLPLYLGVKGIRKLYRR
ncbi:MAG: hypothetical protein HYT70_04340 [Candidatus Aenigmarchaeota archaeon]|nr:hypothetical protein [Candidatus Aenigmarchaeota archaeon]